MSAEIEATAFSAGCEECVEWCPSMNLTKVAAQAWATQHNSEYHPEMEPQDD